MELLARKARMTAAEKTPLETLLASAHEASTIHFPQGVWVCRRNERWEAAFIGKDGLVAMSTTKCGATPEAAMEALRQSVIETLNDKVRSARRDQERYETAILSAKGRG